MQDDNTENNIDQIPEKFRKLINGNPAKRIVLFSLPFFAGDLVHVIYTLIDAFVIGRWLGLNALAAIGAGMSLIWFVYGFCFGLTDGFAVITAQRVGKGDENGVRRSVAAGMTLSLLTAILLTCILLPLIRVLLSLMMIPSEIANDSYNYIFITYSGISFVIFSNMLLGIIRSGGNSFVPMVFTFLGTACKVIFIFLLVAVFPFGIMGAAFATVFADLTVTLLCIIYIIKKYPAFIPGKKDWIPDFSEYKTHLSLGLSMAFMRTIIETGNLILQSTVNSLGAVTIAAVAAAQRVRGLCIIPFFSMSRAMTIFSAQNYGAGRLDRVYKGLFQICLICLGLGIFIAILNQMSAEIIVSLFLPDSLEAIAMASQYILISGSLVVILGIMISFRSTLQGLGMKTAPVLCGIIESIICIFTALILIPDIGFMGVILAHPLAWLVSGIPLYAAFAVYKKKRDENKM